jgi:calcineurin-like phosphoesterase family protein
MSRNIFVISDTHFGHSKFLTFKDVNDELIRKFSSVEEMDETMIENWNKVVKDKDIVYHCGDVYMNDGHKNLARLKGRKRLVVGNHDNLKSEHLHKHFEKIMMWRVFKEHNCVLTHVPIHDSALHIKVDYNIHGHIHEKLSPTNDHINVCVEHHNYTPINLEELMSKR